MALFSRAADLAYKGEHRVRVGAVLSKGPTILRSAHNRSRNNANNVPYGHSTIHAERQVIERVAKSKCTLYVARRALNDSLMPSWPCEECMAHIMACDCVSKICYFDGHAVIKVRI
jgi:deoxycytidylate deaminase